MRSQYLRDNSLISVNDTMFDFNGTKRNNKVVIIPLERRKHSFNYRDIQKNKISIDNYLNIINKYIEASQHNATDSYGYSYPSIQTCNNAKRFINTCLLSICCKIPFPNFSYSQDGEITIIWKSNGEKLCLSFDEEGDSDYLISDEDRVICGYEDLNEVNELPPMIEKFLNKL